MDTPQGLIKMLDAAGLTIVSLEEAVAQLQMQLQLKEEQIEHLTAGLAERTEAST